MKRLTLFALALVLGALIVGALYWYFGTRPPDSATAPLPGPESPLYQEYAQAFEVGVAALDADQYDRALESLSQAIEKVPQEPAAWADRGLLHFRHNDLSRAEQDLQQAHQLAPDSAEIDSLLGLLAERQGRFKEAQELLRKAIERRPEDAAGCYALADLLEREGGAKQDADIQHLLDQILKVQPNNLFVLRRKAMVALRAGDEPAFRAVLGRFEHLSSSWSERSRKELDALKKVSAQGLNKEVSPTLMTLGNVLQVENGFARGATAVTRGNTVGASIQHFLRLQPLRSTPAPADLEMKLVSEPLPGPDPKPGGSVLLAVWLRQEAGPAILSADGKEVRRMDAGGLSLDFPGGARAVPPTRDGILAVDWNNDTRTDLVLAGAGGLRFYQQGADGSFTDVTRDTGLDRAVLEADYHGLWAADIEMDGDLDVMVAPRQGEPVLLRNNGDGTFKPLKLFPQVDGARAFVWADLDNDGAADAAFLDAQGKLHVFANERGSQMRRRAVPDDLGKPLALTAGDVTDDGVLDLLAWRSDGTVLRLSDRDKGQGWDTAPLLRGEKLQQGDQVAGDYLLRLADLDNNGSLDLIAAGPQGPHIWLKDLADSWTELPALPRGQVFSIVDLNRDGRLDLLSLSSEGKPVRLVNHGARSYHWQLIKPRAAKRGEATGDNRINSFGIGGEVELRSGTLVQKQVITAPVVHFGLGENTRADVLRFVWTNGVSQVEFAKAADMVFQAQQRLTGSCPFLFTHDGKGMQFVTDFLWSTPLGLNINGQPTSSFTQTEEWVKVRDDQLAPRDGVYDVRVTANLWEAHFYDYVSLRVVDHPPGSEMFVDERFPILSATSRLQLTGPLSPVARAWDEQGQDVTDLVARTDGRYLDSFGRGRYQGVTKDHWVEVDLGENAPTEGPLWLVARGWLHPTDSSINVAISQGKLDPPRPLVLEVPDGKGGWQVEQPALGFPAGKNKTMLIRLDRSLGKGIIRRFRLRTNMEIYWDSLHYARGLDAHLARQQALAPEKAELRYLGFQEMTQADASSPELPHYDRLAGTAPRWRDLIGFYTRYGDVRELLAKIDDRYLIMNAGDEVRFHFPVPPGPPPGWKRDFVWVCDGWTKDGNMNTGFSRTLLPLPYHGMKSYDRPPGRLEEDPVYKRFPEDWRRYHTRHVTPTQLELGLRSFQPPLS